LAFSITAFQIAQTHGIAPSQTGDTPVQKNTWKSYETGFYETVRKSHFTMELPP
jgi:hypothetical protein